MNSLYDLLGLHESCRHIYRHIQAIAATYWGYDIVLLIAYSTMWRPPAIDLQQAALRIMLNAPYS